MQRSGPADDLLGSPRKLERKRLAMQIILIAVLTVALVALLFLRQRQASQ
jgi:hypothetical protein